METGLVSCEWLRAELAAGKEPIRIVDATWYLPNSPFAAPAGSECAQAEFLAGPRLPSAVFFDIDAVATRNSDGLPHMLPSDETFAATMAALGIEKDTRIVAYDRHGIFSAPRFWYTMKVAFDHPGEVGVLDGGLPRWQALGFPIEMGPPEMPPPAPMSAWNRRPDSAWDLDQVRSNIDSKEALLLDARPAGRFHGEIPEPRAGMRGGHVPGSLNIPFPSVLTANREMLRPEELSGVMHRAGFSPEGLESAGSKVVGTCGSGLSACILGLALHQLGMPLSRFAVYDGSWSEWGAHKDTPIVRRGTDGQDEVVP